MVGLFKTACKQFPITSTLASSISGLPIEELQILETKPVVGELSKLFAENSILPEYFLLKETVTK